MMISPIFFNLTKLVSQLKVMRVKFKDNKAIIRGIVV